MDAERTNHTHRSFRGDDEFGKSVSMSGGRVMAGARNDDDAGGNAGAAYFFTVTCQAPTTCAADVALFRWAIQWSTSPICCW